MPRVRAALLMWRCLVFLAACGAGAPQHPVQPVARAQPGHYSNRIYKIGARLDVADSDHPVITLDGDHSAERLDRRGTSYVDREGRPILRLVDDRSIVVFVHGGPVGVEMGREPTTR